VLNLVDHNVPAGSVLRAFPPAGTLHLVVACAAAGTVRCCVDAATDFIRTCDSSADQLVRSSTAAQGCRVSNSELAAAAAWDAVRRDESVEQHRLAGMALPYGGRHRA
jgi:hypothetical protein